jgi:glycerophosphoryl diester phosphodiesterase
MIEAGRSSAARPPVIIAHRGASGYRPEHTLAAYALAIDQGADYIEPDLVVTGDGVLVARHDNELSHTTDVADRPEFRQRRTRKCIDGKNVDGWFSEDFSLGELKVLRARERWPDRRPCSAAFDGRFEIPTLQEILALLSSKRPPGNASATRLPCGLYVELKHPSYYAGMGFDTARLLLRTLSSDGFPHERERVFIQSFEINVLKQLRRLTTLPLVQLLDVEGSPNGEARARTYRDLMTPAGLAEIATYADAIGPAKDLVAPRLANHGLDMAATLLNDAHRLGLLVHAWTFRLEDDPADQASAGHLVAEVRRYLTSGVDGIFADHPDIAVRARDAWFGG